MPKPRTRRTSAAPDLSQQLSTVERRTRRTPLWGKLLILLLFAAVGGGLFFTANVISATSTVFTLGNQGRSLFSSLQTFKAPPEAQLQGEADDRINILLLGIGGEGHQGPLLTDTIILASLKPSTHQAAFLSIPRDFTVDIPGYGFRKINNAYAFGEADGRGGEELAREVIESVFDTAVHYVVRVDFAGFKEFIDDLGGIDVDVKTAFTDYSYPTDDYGYQTITFASGLQHFDGETALQFTRSRHGTNGEGSDFARSKRQQLILGAAKEKAFSIDTLLNPTRISQAITTLGKHVQTDLQPWELLRLGSLAKTIDDDDILSPTLDSSDGGLLHVVTGIDGAYLLEPRSGTYDEIRQRFADAFVPASTEAAPVIDLLNGTTITGLGGRVATLLGRHDLSVTTVQNAAVRTSPATQVYDLTDGAKPEGLASLLTALQLTEASVTRIPAGGVAPEAIRNDPTLTTADFVVLLGPDALQLPSS